MSGWMSSRNEMEREEGVAKHPDALLLGFHEAARGLCILLKFVKKRRGEGSMRLQIFDHLSM